MEHTHTHTKPSSKQLNVVKDGTKETRKYFNRIAMNIQHTHIDGAFYHFKYIYM